MVATITWEAATRAAMATVSALLTYLFGADRDLLGILAALVALDCVTGLALPRAEGGGTLRALKRSLALFVVVSVAHLLESSIGADSSVLAGPTTMILIAYEGATVLDSAASMGVEIPARLRDALNQLQERGTQDGDRR